MLGSDYSIFNKTVKRIAGFIIMFLALIVVLDTEEVSADTDVFQEITEEEISSEADDGYIGIQPFSVFTIDIGTVVTDGTGYTYQDRVLTFTPEANAHAYILEGTTAPSEPLMNRIVVKQGTVLDITLNNVEMEHNGHSPFYIENGAEVRMILGKDTENLIICSAAAAQSASFDIAGVQVQENAGLIISGNGSLYAEGGSVRGVNIMGGAGVGGGGYKNSDYGNITITGQAKVTALGGGRAAGEVVVGGAGIGGGGVLPGMAGSIHSDSIINIEAEAVVEAYGGGIQEGENNVYGGAGIGSGTAGTGGTVIIQGKAVVTATGGGVTSASSRANWVTGGAGIGGGNRGSFDTVEIKDDASVHAVGGGDSSGISGQAYVEGGAGIGSGAYNSMVNGTIMISGRARVTAVGGGKSGGAAIYPGAGIGGGARSTGAGTIILEGGEITAYSSDTLSWYGSCGIGWGNLGNTVASADVMIGAAAKIKAYSVVYEPAQQHFYPAVGCTDISGDGYLNNVYLTSGPADETFESDISVYQNNWGMMTEFPESLTLPAGYKCFAYTTGNQSDDHYLRVDVNGRYRGIIVNDDASLQNVGTAELISHQTQYIQPVKLDDPKLLITKEVEKNAVENQTFVFRIDGINAVTGDRKIYYSTITVEARARKGTASIRQLPPGSYTVTELFSNWRYESVQTGRTPEVQTLDLAANGEAVSGELVFVNQDLTPGWVSGKESMINQLEPLQ